MTVKALIPAAGRGARLAGIGGGLSKELLPVGPLTMIEHCLGMVIDSGVSEIAVVIRPGKDRIRTVCEEYWQRFGPRCGSLDFLNQDPPRGVAKAMALATDFAGNDPLAVIMPDHLLIDGPPALGRMIEAFNQASDNIIGVIPLIPALAHRFGSVGRIELAPSSADEPPMVAAFSPKKRGIQLTADGGGYYKGLIGVIYVPGWRERVRQLRPNADGEWDDTDLVMELVRESRLRAAVLEGDGFDLGHPAGLEAARRAWDERHS